MQEFTTENAIDFSRKTDILGIETKYAVDASGMNIRPEGEDSLENTFSCVPKVQGESRISQANGQSMRICCAMFICAVLCWDCFFVAIR